MTQPAAPPPRKRPEHLEEMSPSPGAPPTHLERFARVAYAALARLTNETAPNTKRAGFDALSAEERKRYIDRAARACEGFTLAGHHDAEQASYQGTDPRGYPFAQAFETRAVPALRAHFAELNVFAEVVRWLVDGLYRPAEGREVEIVPGYAEAVLAAAEAAPGAPLPSLSGMPKATIDAVVGGLPPALQPVVRASLSGSSWRDAHFAALALPEMVATRIGLSIAQAVHGAKLAAGLQVESKNVTIGATGPVASPR